MFSNHRLSAFVLLALTLLLAGPAFADPICKSIHGRVDLAAGEPSCGSDIGLCAGGILNGTLSAHSDFIGTGFVTTENTEATGDVVLTGDNTIHTQDGDIYTKDSIVLAATGEFAEVDTIVGGTGDYEYATGYLTATGTFLNGVGVGVYVGVVCQP
jgi:hypothetical protein